jgi:glycosyltransferase involved in cell wall biosynthesis
MRILWDFRLFSHGYAHRGVGVYTARTARALATRLGTHRLFVWCEQGKIPQALRSLPYTLIPYQPRSWKSDLVTAPAIALAYRIDLFHYWVALGPIFRCGMGLFHPCRWIATVHDLAVAHLRDPHLDHVRGTHYWRMQRKIACRARILQTNSSATAAECAAFLPTCQASMITVYPPGSPRWGEGAREPRFVTLGGAPRKNARAVLDAFMLFCRDEPRFRLTVCGEVDDALRKAYASPAIEFADMSVYEPSLQSSSALVVCSLYEGLGLPVIDALMCATPCVLSDLPPFREIAGDAALYVDQHSIASIADGMRRAARSAEAHSRAIRQQAPRYLARSVQSLEQLARIYNEGR